MNNCFKIGQRAVDKFSGLARKRGYKIIKASKDEDINEHWDIALIKENKSTYDVKAMKKIQRYDSNVQDEWIWIELHSVRPDNKGWLLDGKADFIAFEMKNSFLIIPRLKLISLVQDLVKKERVSYSYQAKYKIYQRKGRCDQLSLIESKYLRLIAFEEWKNYEYNK